MQHNRFIWGATALILLAGCQKTDKTGTEIRFEARSLPETATKAVYTGDKNDSGFERIDWEVGDKIRIYNDKATCSGDANYYWADYTVGSVASSSNRYSTGQLNVSSSRGGLTWGTGTHTFYGVYPSPETDEDADKHDLSSFNGTIQQTQTGKLSDINAWTGTGKVYYPSNNKPILVGYAQLTAGTDGTLDFEPAYSAFHISAGVDVAMTVTSVELRSADHKLCGEFTVSRSGSAWSFGGLSVSDAADKAVTFTLPSPGVTLNTSDKLELVLYTVPQTLDDLTLVFHTNMGGRTLELKKAAAAGGDWVAFSACHKAYIKGLLVPGATWTIDNTTEIKMQESVADWGDAAMDAIEYETSGIIFNATGLNQTGTGGKSFDFSLFAPAGKTWKVTARNASDGSVAKEVEITPETGSASTDGVLSGIIGSPNPWIHFTADSGTDGNNYYLTFSVDVDGTEYSIDSEVARGGWGPGKTYSYFSF